MRSFMAASTMTKFFWPVRFTYSTRVTRMPELPEMKRPGSTRMRRPSGSRSGTRVPADFGVRAGVDVRVDADGDGGFFLEARGDFVDADEFGFAFDVEGINSLAEREFDFLFGFADAGEHAFFRVATGGNDAAQLAFAHD